MAFVINCKSQNTNYWRRDRITMAYFNDIKDFPLLSQEDEKKLLYIAKYGKNSEKNNAIKKIIESNQRFIVSIARKFSVNDNLLDIVNEANLGLIKAIENYDIEKREHFITYAIFWVRKYINNYIITKESSVVPYNAPKIYTYCRKIRNEFFNKEERYPTNEELQAIINERYNLNINYLDELHQFQFNSIDENVINNKGENYSYEDNSEFSRITCNDNVSEETDKNDTKYIINLFLSQLKPRESDIIRRYYGIDCEEQQIESIAKLHNLTRERVRQIINECILKLRENKEKIFKI